MKKIWLALGAFVLLCSHTMFLKLDSYFLKPNTKASIDLFNGTFDKSENVITRDRMLDVSILNNGQRTRVTDSQWAERDSITVLNFKTGEEGTYVAGVSTAPRSIEMDAEAFNTYLEHEGISDMIAARENSGSMDSAAVEKYSKHVKTIFQVGNKRTDDWKKALGYPIEFVPLQNPYELNTGDSLKVKLLFNGEPLANQLVYADFKAPEDEHTHENQAEHGHSHDEATKEEHSHDSETADHAHNNRDTEKHSHGDETTEHSHAEVTNEHSHDSEAADHTHDNSDTEKHSHGDETTEHSHAEVTEEHSHNSETADHTHDNSDTKKHSHGDETTEHSHAKESEEHSHDTEEKVEPHTHTSGQKLRTDADGVITAALTADGIWYLQTINLVKTHEESFTHESNWTTLTFQVTHAHGEDSHTHDHEDEGGIPSWAYWAGSILLVGILFFVFNKNK